MQKPPAGGVHAVLSSSRKSRACLSLETLARSKREAWILTGHRAGHYPHDEVETQRVVIPEILQETDAAEMLVSTDVVDVGSSTFQAA